MGPWMGPNGPTLNICPKGPKRTPPYAHIDPYGAFIGPNVSVGETVTADSPRPTIMTKTYEKAVKPRCSLSDVSVLPILNGAVIATSTGMRIKALDMHAELVGLAAGFHRNISGKGASR
jgi:hypothetical protein